MAKNLSVLARQFSTSTANNALVRSPVPVYGIEGKYATALYSAAHKQKALDAVEKDLSGFTAALKADKKMGDFLYDPSIQKTLKNNGLIAIAEKMKMNELSKNLLLAVSENNRFQFLPAISNAFSTIMAGHRGEVVCEVTTAKPLDAAMAKEVEGALAGFLKKGEKALVNYKDDPAIIGGMVVSVGDKFCDMSMATKLNKYSELIKSAA
uniref:Oligomycin sensitivity conferral protein n=1 Tax=Acartia pacifica TaxID=335913 RepID=A0A0U2IG28_ACAPC|nr:mitochondrial ATP synthase subunit O precursor [Acartia pacifica]